MIYHINPEKRAVCCRMPAHEEGHDYELWEVARNQAMAKLRRYVKGVRIETVIGNCMT